MDEEFVNFAGRFRGILGNGSDPMKMMIFRVHESAA
jgi:hypothetical protein